jgi:hypothetical protein
MTNRQKESDRKNSSSSYVVIPSACPTPFLSSGRPSVFPPLAPHTSRGIAAAHYLFHHYRRRSGSLLPLLLLRPPSCGPACVRLGLARAPANEDIDAHTSAASYISPGWDAASRLVPHLFLPLPFPFLPLHLPPSLLHFDRVNTGRFRCRRGWLDRFSRDARARLGMVGCSA